MHCRGSPWINCLLHLFGLGNSWNSREKRHISAVFTWCKYRNQNWNNTHHWSFDLTVACFWFCWAVLEIVLISMSNPVGIFSSKVSGCDRSLSRAVCCQPVSSWRNVKEGWVGGLHRAKLCHIERWQEMGCYLQGTGSEMVLWVCLRLSSPKGYMKLPTVAQYSMIHSCGCRWLIFGPGSSLEPWARTADFPSFT